MASKQEQSEKKCWACKTILVEDGKLSLCPNCINKYGSPVATAMAVVFVFAGKQLMKNGDKIVKVAKNVAKNIK